MAVSGNDIFAGGDSGSIYRSGDEGATWMLVNSGIGETIAVRTIAVSPKGVLIGTDSGVMISSDRGDHWDKFGLDGDTVYDLAIAGSDIYACTGSHGLFRSVASTPTWQLLRGGKAWNIASTDGRLLLVAGSPWCYHITEGGDSILRSLDTGRTWLQPSDLPFFTISGGDPGPTFTFLAARGPLVYAVTPCSYSERDGGGGLIGSTDYGLTWSIIPSSLLLSAWTHLSSLDIIGANLFGGLFTTATGYGVGVARSTDSGTTWIRMDSGLPASKGPFIVLSSQTNLFAASPDSGLWRRPLSEIIGQSAVAESPLSNHEIRSYPNPFSESTIVTIKQETTRYADVRIVNLRCEEVARLFSGELEAGEHFFIWDAKGVPAGMYECIVRMNGETQREGMMVIR
jgi:hypothetical protein